MLADLYIHKSNKHMNHHQYKLLNQNLMLVGLYILKLHNTIHHQLLLMNHNYKLKDLYILVFLKKGKEDKDMMMYLSLIHI